jgi:hypothetical protein
MLSGTKSGSAAWRSAWTCLKSSWYSMASLMEAVAKQRVEAAPSGGGVVLGEDGVDDSAFGQGFTGPGRVFAVGLEVIHVESEGRSVFDGVGDGVGVEFALEKVLGGAQRLACASICLDGGVVEDRRAGEAEELGLGEEVLDGLVVLAELGAVALVEDEDHALVAQRFEALLVGGLPFFLPACCICWFRPGRGRASGWW